ncbi:hypothetical protein BG005_002725 [Podila minutissima]|nr:hypothetical protein BG005_002725 [Podila minutissima]
MSRNTIHFKAHVNQSLANGIYPPLASNLKSTMGIDTPSQLQRNFIPPILDGTDVLIRDTTGSGKTFGILLSLLSKPRTKSASSGSLGITSVLVVPNQELAFQLVSWTRSLFPNATQQQLDEMIQAIYTESSPHSPTHARESTKSKRTTSKHDRQPFTPLGKDTQVEKLANTLPHVLVTTPVRLWSLIERGVLDLSGIETLVLDEVDHLIRLPKRFASQRQIFNRDLHPKPAELAVREIIRSAKAAGRYGAQEAASKSDRIQIVAASATMNRPIRHWLERNDWIQDPEWVDTTKSVVLPEGIEHHCLVVGPDSIRNMKLEGDYKHATEDVGEVDWADKDKSWKEQRLSPSEETTKFRDDDDRMLEGVATACMLDEIQTACVFFCSSPSLNDVATRLQGDFGLSAKLLEDAFHANQGSTQELIRRKGVYLAHESNARGLDLPGLSHVFIVGMPSTPSSYLHMAGRTGRMGKKGSVLTIIRDEGNLEARARSLFNTLNVQIQPYSHVE